MRAFVLFACLWLAFAAWAGEVEDRQAVFDQVAADFERSDFAGIEKRYAEARAMTKRSASGIFVDTMVVDFILPRIKPPAPGSPQPTRGRDEHWNPVEEKVQRWAAQFPASALPVIVLSRAYSRHGWAYRGSGFAHTVTPQDWEKFHGYLRKAQDTLVSRREAGEKDPNWWAEMIVLAREQGWPREQSNMLAVKAMDAFPGHYSIYFRISESLVPKWGGSMEELAAFSEEAVRRTRQAEGESLYGRIFWNLFDSLRPDERRSGHLPWARVRAGMNDVVQRYPEGWNLNWFARIACDMQDKPTTRALLVRIEDNLLEAAWYNRAQMQRCRNWSNE